MFGFLKSSFGAAGDKTPPPTREPGAAEDAAGTSFFFVGWSPRLEIARELSLEAGDLGGFAFLADVLEVTAATFEMDLEGAALELASLAALELPVLATLELLVVVAAFELLALEATDLGGALLTLESAGV